MKITETLVDYLENLSKLKLSQTEKKEVRKDLTDLLDYMEILERVDVDELENEPATRKNNCFREDIITEEDMRSEILKNAPDSKGDYFRVFKAVE